MKKTLLTYCMLGLALLSFSCDDEKEADDIIPEIQISMDRTFMYHDNHEIKHASYTTDDCQTGFIKDDGKLTVFIDAGADAISFQVDEENLIDGYIGNYTLMSLPNPDNGKAKTTYSYSITQTSGNAYFSQANYLGGSFVITDYNEKHNLISGTFELTMEDVPDPTQATSTPAPRRCDITVTGTFENAKMMTNP